MSGTTQTGSPTPTGNSPVVNAAVLAGQMPVNSGGTNGGSVSDPIVDAANSAAQTMAPDPAGEINAGFPDAGTPLYSNFNLNYKFKAPRKVGGKPATDPFGKLLETRAPVSLVIPVPTWEAVKQFVGAPGDVGQRNRDWLLDVLQDVVKENVRQQVYDEDLNARIQEQEQLNTGNLSLDFLVTIPKSERTGRGIPKEIWDEWQKDYIEVMAAQGIRTNDKISAAADALKLKFNTVKTNRKIVDFLMGELNMWAANTNSLEDYEGIYDFLKKRGEDIVKADAVAQMSAFE